MTTTVIPIGHAARNDRAQAEFAARQAACQQHPQASGTLLYASIDKIASLTPQEMRTLGVSAASIKAIVDAARGSVARVED